MQELEPPLKGMAVSRTLAGEAFQTEAGEMEKRGFQRRTPARQEPIRSSSFTQNGQGVN
jgi:hypothetical protein